MITVSELIELLKKENPSAIVLVAGYEYGNEYFRESNLITGKFNPIADDLGNWKLGGLIRDEEKGTHDYLLFDRET
jgi:hypothetical protein